MISYEKMTIKETEENLNTSIDRGLSLEEVKSRQEKYGKNILKEEKKPSKIKIFLSQLNDPMIFVLFGAILLTILISIYETVKTIKNGDTFSFTKTGDWPDVVIILAVIFINAIIGTIQEIKALNSLEALKKMSSPLALVLRDGKKSKIKSEDLVVGDIVYIEDGDTVCADLRLVETHNLKVMESSLTGEVEPVLKDSNITFSNNVGIADRINEAFASTTVTYGRGCGIVINTGMSTEIGKIASYVSEEESKSTPLQNVLAKLSKILGYLTLAIVLVVLVIDIIWIFIDGKNLQLEPYIEAILSSISLAVAAIPEGLAAVVTIVLSIGVSRMAHANTIVRKLHSVETLGSVSVICSDKTGTLTQNKMTVTSCYTLNNYYDIESNDYSMSNSLELLSKGMSLCSNASIDGNILGDPTEVALLLLAEKLDLNKKIIEENICRIDELPFESQRKMMSVLVDDNGKNIVYTKGALDSILKHTTKILDNNVIRNITKEDIDKIEEANKHYSSLALRVLALAYKEANSISEDDLVFVGLTAMIDPPRKEVPAAIEKLKNAGIKTIMITGDHKATAFAVANKIGLCTSIDECMTGEELDKLSEEEIKEVCKYKKVFARVSPENKVQIVSAFQSLGHICAMTGDGVNDAPSLSKANIGISMGITGTDVAKDASDMILQDDNFASIELAVEEGRGIYENIKKVVYFLLGSNIAEVFAMLLLIVIGLPQPLIAIHLLWVNLITDSFPAIALGMQPKDKNIMDEKPRNPNEGIFANNGLFQTLFYGAVITIGVVIAYLSCGWLNGAYSISDIKTLYEENNTILLHAQTMAFTTLAFSEIFHMLGSANIKKSVKNIFSYKNYMLYIAFALGILLQLLVIEVPSIRELFSTSNLSLNEWLITLSFSILPLVIHEIIILINYIKFKMNKKTQNNLK